MAEILRVSDETTVAPLDHPFTIREFMELIGYVRDTGPRDGLRALENCLLDLVGRA